ncbi:hypothetical protein Glove_283g57 [Diversispora epigaea]|uniref:Uncharacterized protein n=1 Tax=Diversispora epigaea TaxID=1348612 RepID=A0A397I1G5_9GLOM|nr:hypothetical protein Glove_283g57 [Diversispora epigaea]
MEKKGSGTRIAKEVVDLLKGFFHAGNANSTDNNELEYTKISKVKTIRNWISRYSTAMKKEMAERMLASFSNNIIAKGRLALIFDLKSVFAS